MKKTGIIAVFAAGAAGPAAAAPGSFFSLGNTDFIVTIAFLIFVGILIYYKVPTIIGDLLDKRAGGIRRDLDEAKRLREEAQEIYASYERRQREVSGQADQIIANAKREAEAQAAKAKEDLKISIERRLKAAEEQIASAESDAVRAVRDRAVRTAVAAASELLAQQVAAGQRSAGIDDAIEDVARRLN
ncbi:MAG: F0F1 ATP synthase subunit B [Paracoccus sp. (in: a-proteobacteria)]|jgi:F-type H+-transporting ATPase subunit b|uniref:F0F1 ATP synthase subunit B n=1 Tax=unclassified Paracoccus (in: a-proteobacteria) TaxID=2688777 RepID=UPI000C350ADF|nr:MULTISPECIES: F0F1 ATP synthase subunit B [unclassified Paracoccus (in: a-proteobacteria)]MAN56272.1 ATP F0F1 synthase subunit B [Paracoccus sp. (in: a-proteobacteria)]MBA49013.1 ATP F0F1 synthase subunit B [Paracoccus sp. (in: a-proteobacteria)]MDB2552371.1 F0F1 ATP synthase subunit B [Paracoccus sp. (in: a-proteobacteria)]|tara:strand:- start:722 stop:1285 length:564 start_codon:yes stop_codon:yes gene_type:complete